MAARRRLCSMAVQVGSLCGSPATRARPWCGRYTSTSCACVAGGPPTLIGRPMRPKSRSLCGVLAMRTRFGLLKCAAKARARGVPKSRRRRVAASAAFIEMRRIKGYFRYWAARAPGHSSARARAGRRGAASQVPNGVYLTYLPAAPSSSGRASPRPCLFAALAGSWHPAPRARRAGLHSEENPAAAIQILCCV